MKKKLLILIALVAILTTPLMFGRTVIGRRGGGHGRRGGHRGGVVRGRGHGRGRVIVRHGGHRGRRGGRVIVRRGGHHRRPVVIRHGRHHRPWHRRRWWWRTPVTVNGCCRDLDLCRDENERLRRRLRDGDYVVA